MTLCQEPTSVPPACAPSSATAVSDSSKLHLLAVTADGRRVYFTTLSTLRTPSYQPTASAQTGAGGDGGPRPVALTAVHARPALPHAGLAMGRIAAADLSR